MSKPPPTSTTTSTSKTTNFTPLSLFSKLNRYSRSLTFRTQIESPWLHFSGGCLTLLLFLVVFLYAAVLFTRLVSRTDIKVTQNIVKTDIDKNPQTVLLTDFDDIEFQLVVTKWDGSVISDSEIISVLNLDVLYTQFENGEPTKTFINFSECSEEFAGIHHGGDTGAIISWCFKLSGFELSGNRINEEDKKQLIVELLA